MKNATRQLAGLNMNCFTQEIKKLVRPNFRGFIPEMLQKLVDLKILPFELVQYDFEVQKFMKFYIEQIEHLVEHWAEKNNFSSLLTPSQMILLIFCVLLVIGAERSLNDKYLFKTFFLECNTLIVHINKTVQAF